MNVRPVGADLLHADRHSGRYEKHSWRLSQFCRSI